MLMALSVTYLHYLGAITTSQRRGCSLDSESFYRLDLSDDSPYNEAAD